MKGEAAVSNPLYRASVAVLLVLGVGIATSAILSVWLYKIETKEAQLVFQRDAHARLDAFGSGLSDAVDALVTVNQLFTVVPNVSRQQFHAFTQPLLERLPYVQTFAFQRIVSHADRPAYEAELRKQFPGFAIRDFDQGKLVPARDKAHYRVAEYIEPIAGNTAILGFDASSMPYEDDAVLRAGASGRPAATGLFRLVRETSEQRGFLVVMPVYRHTAAAGDKPAGERGIVGYTAAVFRAADLAEKILGSAGLLADGNVDIALYEGAAPIEKNLAFRRENGIAPSRPDHLPWQLAHTGVQQIARTFDTAGGRWHMVISPTAASVLFPHAASWLVLLIGGATSLLFAVYIRALAWRASELVHANQALRRSQLELRELSTHQERVKENERKRIAREIHDDLGQNLLALRIDVTILERQTANIDPALAAATRALLGQIDVTVRSVRNIINNLRPAVLDLGLSAAIEWQVHQLNARHRTVFRLSVENEDVGAALDNEYATAIFRIVQESLINVVRHANASRAEISLSEHTDKLHIVISDNGVGSFPHDRRKPRSFGLIGIKERIAALGGEFSMESVAERGTTLTFKIAARHAVKKELEPA